MNKAVYLLTSESRVKTLINDLQICFESLFENQQLLFQTRQFSEIEQPLKNNIEQFIHRRELYKEFIKFLGNNLTCLIIYGNNKLEKFLSNNIATYIGFEIIDGKITKTYPNLYKGDILSGKKLNTIYYFIHKKFLPYIQNNFNCTNINFDECINLKKEIIDDLKLLKNTEYEICGFENYVYFTQKQLCYGLYHYGWEPLNCVGFLNDFKQLAPIIVYNPNKYSYKYTEEGFYQPTKISEFCYIINEKFNTSYNKDDLLVRSSWESNIIKLLNFYHISFRYENNMFHLYDSKKSFNYVPDFFLDNKILEIKGSWDDASLNKCYLFNKEYFKQYEFFIIDYDVYYILNKSMSEKIENWGKQKVYIRTEKIGLEERFAIVDNPNCNDIHSLKLLNAGEEYKVAVISKSANISFLLPSQWAFVYGKKLDMGIKYEVRIEQNERGYLLKIKAINLDEININQVLISKLIKKDKV